MTASWDSLPNGQTGGNGSIDTGVGVLDRSMTLLWAVREGPCTLAVLTERTGLARATTHRLAGALLEHGLLARDASGRYVLGLAWVGWGRAAAAGLGLIELAAPVLGTLREGTGESVQLFVPAGAPATGGRPTQRVCVVALESPHGLRTIVPLGAVLPIDRGSAGRALLGEAAPGEWVETAGEREPGVSSVSAAVWRAGAPVAAVSVSGPIERMGRRPGRRYGHLVAAAARDIGLSLDASA